MTLATTFKRFWTDAAGAATVDWTIISTGLVLASVLIAMIMLGLGLFDAGGSIGQTFQDALFESRGAGY